MTFTRMCVDCDATIEYKSEAYYKDSCKRKPTIRCRSCSNRIATKKQWADPDGKVNQPEHRAKKSRAQKAAWANPDSALNQPEFGEKIAESVRQYQASLHGQQHIPESGRKLTNAQLKKWSNRVKTRDDWTCQECDSIRDLHAHHVKHARFHPELANDVDNGITLCELCHAKKHPHVSWMKKILEKHAKDERIEV
jgi:hypothetical protein